MVSSKIKLYHLITGCRLERRQKQQWQRQLTPISLFPQPRAFFDCKQRRVWFQTSGRRRDGLGTSGLKFGLIVAQKFLMTEGQSNTKCCWLRAFVRHGNLVLTPFNPYSRFWCAFLRARSKGLRYGTTRATRRRSIMWYLQRQNCRGKKIIARTDRNIAGWYQSSDGRSNSIRGIFLGLRRSF